MTWTRWPELSATSSACAMTRVSPLSSRTVISRPLVLLTWFSTALPARPPSKAPPIDARIWPRPPPMALPATPPRAAPPRAPTPEDLSDWMVTGRTDTTVP